MLTLACLLCATVHGQERVDQGGGAGSRNSPAADDLRRESPAAPINPKSPEASCLGLASVAFRSGRGGLFAHHWVEVQTSRGSYTLDFGPALIPFIDRGQITVEDRYGHIEWRYLLHPFSLHWNFARAPGIAGTSPRSFTCRSAKPMPWSSANGTSTLYCHISPFFMTAGPMSAPFRLRSRENPAYPATCC